MRGSAVFVPAVSLVLGLITFVVFGDLSRVAWAVFVIGPVLAVTLIAVVIWMRK